jgi:hypothetical protein
MDIDLSLYEDGIEQCVKPPIDGSAVMTEQAKLVATGNSDSRVLGEWFGRRSQWLRSAIKKR